MSGEARNERKKNTASAGSRWGLLAGLIALGAISPGAALADEGYVRTTGGDVYRGEVLDHREGEDVRVVVEGGDTVRIPADRVGHVETPPRPTGRFPTLMPPLAAMVTGLVLGGVGLFLGPLSLGCIGPDWEGDCEDDEDPEADNLGIGLAVTGGIIFALGAFVLLPLQVRKRRAWRQRLERLRIRVTPRAGRHGGSLTLSGSF